MGFPPRRVVRRRAGRPRYTGVWSRARRQHDQVRPDVLRGLLDRARLPRREPDRQSLEAARVQHKTTVDRSRSSAEQAAASTGSPLPMASAGTKAMADIPVALARRRAPRRRPRWARCCDDQRQARPATTSGSSASADDIVVTGVGEAHFAASGRHRGRRRGADRQLGLPRVPDLPPPPGPPATSRCGTSSAPPASPMYPQRPKLIGPRFARQGVGLDPERPVRREDDRRRDASWTRPRTRGRPSEYRDLVEAALGPKHRRPVPPLVRRPRACTRPGPVVMPTRRGRSHDHASSTTAASSQQALRDVAAWVEHGIAPPPSTEFEVDRRPDRQSARPPGDRRGIQPVATSPRTARARRRRRRRAGAVRRRGRGAARCRHGGRRGVGLRRRRRLSGRRRRASTVPRPTARVRNHVHVQRARHVLPGAASHVTAPG